MAEDSESKAEQLKEAADQLHETAKHINNVADEIAQQPEAGPQSGNETAVLERPATRPDYLIENEENSSRLPGDDPITRPDY